MNTKTLKGITAAVSLLVAVPTVEAVTIRSVNITDGFVDVDKDGVLGEATDDLLNVALWCNVAAPTQVDIIDGEVDVTEDLVVDASDHLSNCDLNDESNLNGIAVLIPQTNRVDIIDGGVDVTEVGGVTAFDDAPNVKLFVLP
ncbi:MAG: hypothetical protein ACHBNF_04745 [Chromatiales bacterium]